MVAHFAGRADRCFLERDREDFDYELEVVFVAQKNKAFKLLRKDNMEILLEIYRMSGAKIGGR